MKIILTLLVFIVAFYLAAMMFRRLTQTAHQLGELRSDLAKSDAQLQVKLAALQAERDALKQDALTAEASSTQTNTENQTSSGNEWLEAKPRNTQAESREDNTTKEL